MFFNGFMEISRKIPCRGKLWTSAQEIFTCAQKEPFSQTCSFQQDSGKACPCTSLSSRNFLDFYIFFQFINSLERPLLLRLFFYKTSKEQPGPSSVFLVFPDRHEGVLQRLSTRTAEKIRLQRNTRAAAGKSGVRCAARSSRAGDKCSWKSV